MATHGIYDSINNYADARWEKMVTKGNKGLKLAFTVHILFSFFCKMYKENSDQFLIYFLMTEGKTYQKSLIILHCFDLVKFDANFTRG